MAHFHITSDSVKAYQLVPFLQPETKRIVLHNYQESQRLAAALQPQKDPLGRLSLIKPWLINGHALLHALYHRIFQKTFPDSSLIWDSFHKKLAATIPSTEINHTRHVFQQLFLMDHVKDWSSSIDEEMLYLWLANQNPALFLLTPLIQDQTLTEQSAYQTFIDVFRGSTEPNHDAQKSAADFITFLMEPIRQAPNDLLAQLDFIRTHWQEMLGEEYLMLLNGMDFIREEEKIRFPAGHSVQIPVFSQPAEEEIENFSPDQNWMPKLVLIAKNIYVWLHQLSKTYQREIRTLDQIPEEALQELAARGFTGLWLIGVWERSRGSATIKRLCGNPEALASAYSLSEYQIAADLGGEAAYYILKSRALSLGIRLGTDMVPNHMGLDSPWVKNHPDWFISLDTPPYPSYTYHGPDLSDDPGYTIQIEDHYYDRSDAAVVFRYQNHKTGDTRFIYHGNDGTSMPWNDTAQLNYLDARVREEVIQTILRVARLSPIIRFDAAMILTKRHYQRLWYPTPGNAGDIPSRAGKGMTEEAFNQALPVEFWREVVDRIAEELPDTLLLAEAFWLMESYFVRTLGMHRVYNSAFMHLLRDEDNQDFLCLIRNTLEYNPEILKRYVNFMNNPDEDTAVHQFSKDDKYFGVCTLLATFPGLPMFGHGQIEGFYEKYGMEYRQAYLDEKPDPALYQRHEREIFPLLKRRFQFSEVHHFHMYDFLDSSIGRNENVYAYSNQVNGHHSLVVFHNQYAETSGWIHHAWTLDSQSAESGITLAEALEIPQNSSAFVIFRDQITQLEHIQKAEDLHRQGFFLSLKAYEYHAFIDFRILSQDAAGIYQSVHDLLMGSGTPSIEQEALQFWLAPLITCAAKYPISELEAGVTRIAGYPALPTAKAEADQVLVAWHAGLIEHYTLPALRFLSESQWKNILKQLDQQIPVRGDLPLSELPLEGLLSLTQLVQQIIDPIFNPTTDMPGNPSNQGYYTTPMHRLLEPYNLDEDQKNALLKFQSSLLVWMKILDASNADQVQADGMDSLGKIIERKDVQTLLQVNTYQGITWFHQESYWLFLLAGKVLNLMREAEQLPCWENFTLIEWYGLAEKSEYQLKKLLEALNQAGKNPV